MSALKFTVTTKTNCCLFSEPQLWVWEDLSLLLLLGRVLIIALGATTTALLGVVGANTLAREPTHLQCTERGVCSSSCQGNPTRQSCFAVLSNP